MLVVESPTKRCEECVHFSGCYPAEYGGAKYYNTRMVAETCEKDSQTENNLYWKR